MRFPGQQTPFRSRVVASHPAVAVSVKPARLPGPEPVSARRGQRTWPQLNGRESNMETAPIVGIDVALASLEVAIEGQPATTQVANNLAGRATLVRHLQHQQPELVVLEASGGYEQGVMDSLWAASLPVVRVNPRQVRRFAQASGRWAKTDAIDAAVLVHFGRVMTLKAQTPPSPARRELAQLQARREDLVTMRVAEMNRLQQTSHPQVRTGIERVIACLTAEERALEVQMDALIAADAEVRQQARILRSVPGIGAGNVRLLLGGLPELGQASPKEVAALVGVAPFNHDSGRLRGKRAIGGGRAAVRHGLYMAVITAKRHNPVIRSFYERLVAGGKAKRVAEVACIRKLVGILNAMLRDDTLWQPPESATT